MKDTITNLAVSNGKRNRTRSILIMISVFLSALLLTVIAEFGYGMVQFSRINVGKMHGNYCGVFQNVTKEQYETIKRHSEFEQIGRSAFVAEIQNQEAKLSLFWIDSQGAENTNLTDSVAEGTLPGTGNDLAAPVEFFAKAGVEHPKVGETVVLSIRSDQASKFSEKEFVISGILASSKSSDFQKSFQGYVSQDFYESLFPEEMQSYHVNFQLNPSVQINADIGEEVIKELGALCGIKEKNISVNSMYLIWAYDPGTETLITCIGIGLIVILVSVAVIYNIFQVGIVQKIQEYGKIKALGATKKQLKKLIFREGMVLAAVAIPLGLAVGALVAAMLFEWLMLGDAERMTQVEMISVSVVSVPVLLVSAVCAFFTVWLSLRKPMRVVAAISPVEAVRYQENTKINHAVRERKGKVTVFGLTCSNLWANRKRTVTTVMTMGLSCVLFVVLANLAGNIDNEFAAREQVEYGQFLLSLDYSLTDQAYPENNLDEIQKSNPLGKEFQEKLKTIPGVIKVHTRNVFSVKENTGSGKNERVRSVCVLNRQDFERYSMSSVLGTVDYDQVAEADGIIYGYSHFFEEDGYTLGNKIGMEIQDTERSIPLETKIMGAFGHAPATWAITEETWKKLNIRGDLTESVWIDCEPAEREHVESVIREQIAGWQHVELVTYEEAMENVRFATRIIQMGIYAFIGIIGLIAFLNMASTIIIGVVTRKRELGILQAVGMTNHQLNRMLQLEGILFSVGTVAVSLVVGCPLGFVIFRYAKEHGIYGLNQYQVPLSEIMIMTGVIVLMQMLLSYCLSRNLRKESLVERINYQE